MPSTSRSGRRPGEIARLSIPVAVTFTGLLVLVVLGFTALHYFFPAQRETIVFLAVAATAAATIGSMFYLGHSIRLELRQKVRDEAFRFMSRWNSPELFHSRLAFYKVIAAHRSGGAAAVQEALKDDTVALGVQAVLNMFEEISIAVEHGHADEELSCRAFAGLLIRSHEALREWIIENRRISGRPKVWTDFEALYSKWRDR